MEYSSLSISGFTQVIETWQAILDECDALKISIGRHYAYQYSNSMHFQFEVSGDWHQLAKFESQLIGRKKQLDPKDFLHWQRIIPESTDRVIKLPYLFEVVAIAELFILNTLIGFIKAAKSVEIKEVILEQFVQPKTTVFMQKTKVLAYIPIHENIPELRENFMIFCEQYRIDGMLELDRN